MPRPTRPCTKTSNQKEIYRANCCRCCPSVIRDEYNTYIDIHIQTTVKYTPVYRLFNICCVLHIAYISFLWCLLKNLCYDSPIQPGLTIFKTPITTAYRILKNVIFKNIKPPMLDRYAPCDKAVKSSL